MPSYLSLIKESLDQADWPDVIRALLISPGIWGKLTSSELGEMALSAAGSKPQLWTPAFLAFLEMEQEEQYLKFQADEISALDDEIRFAGLEIIERIRSGKAIEFEQENQLQVSVKIAIGLYERGQLATEEQSFESDFALVPAELVDLVLTCLVGIFPAPLQYLRLIANLNNQSLGRRMTRAFFALPQTDTIRLSQFELLSENCDVRQWLQVLENLSAFVPDFAKLLAAQSTEKVEIGDISTGPYEKMERLQLSAKNLKLAGEHEKAQQALNQAWELGQEIQDQIAKGISIAKNTSDKNALGQKKSLTPSGEIGLTDGRFANAWKLLDSAQVSHEQNKQVEAIEMAQQAWKESLGQETAREENDGGSKSLAIAFAQIFSRLTLLEQARSAVELALGDFPKAEEALLGAQIASQSGDFDQELEYMHLANILDPENGAIKEQLAKVLQSQGRYEEAYAIWTECLDDISDASQDQLLLFAESAIHGEHFASAIKLVQQIIKRFPHNPLGFAYFGDLNKDESPVQALAAYEKAVNLDPSLTKAWLGQVEITKQINGSEKAIEILEDGISQAAESSQLRLQLGISFEESNQIEEAIDALVEGLQFSKIEKQAAVTEANVYQLANLWRNQGLVVEALEILRECYSLNSGNTKIAALFGRTLLDIDLYEEAIEVLVPLSEDFNGDRHWKKMLAQAYGQSQETQPEAIQLLNEILREDPKDFDAAIRLALLKEMQGDLESAKRSILKLERKINDSSVDTGKALLIAKSLVLSKEGDHNSAIELIKTELEDDPSNLELVSTLAVAFQKNELAEEAFQIINQHWLTSNKDLPSVLWFAKEAGQLGKTREAIEAIEDYFRNDGFVSQELTILLGKLQWKLGEWRSEKTFAREFLSAHSAGLEALTQLADFLANESAHRAAIDFLKAATEKNGESNGRIGVRLANSYLALGEKDKSLEIINNQFGEISNDSKELFRVGQMYAVLGERGKAFECYEMGLQLDPSNKAALKRYVELLLAAGNSTKAFRILEAAIDEKDSSNEANIPLAINLAIESLSMEKALGWIGLLPSKQISDQVDEIEANLWLSQDERADILLDEIKSDHTPALIAIQARRQHSNGNIAEAEALYKEALRELGKNSRGNNSGDQFSVALCANALGHWESGKKLLSQLIKQNERSARYRYALANMLISQIEWDQRMNGIFSKHKKSKEYSSSERLDEISQLLDAAAERMDEKDGLEAILSMKLRAGLRLDPQSIEQLSASFPSNAEEAAALEYASASNANLADFQSRLKEFPDAAELYFEAALTNISSDPENAHKLAIRALYLSYGQADYLALTALTAKASGNTTTAIEYLQEALQIWPDEDIWHAKLGQWLHEEGLVSSALSHLEEAVELDKSNAHHFSRLGKAQEKSGQFQSAVASFAEANRLNPESASIQFALAEVLLSTGEAKKASQIINKIKVASEDEAHYLFLNSKIQLKKGDQTKALSYAKQALQIENHNGQLISHYADILIALGKKKQALRLLEISSKRVQDSLPLEMKAAKLTAEIETDFNFVGRLQNLIQKYPGEAKPAIELAQVLFQEGHLEIAQESGEKALEHAKKLDPIEHAKLLLLFARCNKDLGQLDQSLHYLERAANVTEALPEIHMEMGKVFLSRRQRHSAMNAFEKAAKAETGSSDAWLHIAQMHKVAKDYGEAEEALRKAAELSPSNIEIQKQLAAVMALNLVSQANSVGVGS